MTTAQFKHIVVITDPTPVGLTACIVNSVQDGAGTPLANTGNLFAGGLLLTNPLAGNDGSLGAPLQMTPRLSTTAVTSISV